MEQNQIKGMQVAVAKVKYVAEKDGSKKPGYECVNNGEIHEIIGKLQAEKLDVKEEAFEDCIKQLEDMGSFEELSKKFNGGNGNEIGRPGLVIRSKKDPRMVCSVEFGSPWNSDRTMHIATSPKGDLVLKFFLDNYNEEGALDTPERSASEEELDLVNMLRGMDLKPVKKHESYTSMKPLVEMKGVDDILGVEAKKQVLTENLNETGEADQDYSKAEYDAICKLIEKNGMKCSHKEFDKYQGVFIKVDGITKLWSVDYFVKGKAKPPKGKYRSANLVGPEGDKYSANKGDYFMEPRNHVFKDHDLLLVMHDGTSETIHNPKVSDLPDSRDMDSGIEFEGTPDDVIVLECEKDESRFEVVVRKNKVLDDDGLIEHLKNMKEKMKMESKFNDFDSVDFFGLPKSLTEAEMIQKDHKAVKDSELMVGDVKEKEKEIEKKAEDLKGHAEPNKAGEPIAKPHSELHGDSVQTKQSELPADKIKVGEPGEKHGDHVEGKGKVDDQQKEVPANKVKVGEPGEKHGEHMGEDKRQKLAAYRKEKMESIRANVQKKIVEARKQAVAKFKTEAAAEAPAAPKAEASAPTVEEGVAAQRKELASEKPVKKESKHMPDTVMAKLKEMMKKKQHSKR